MTSSAVDFVSLEAKGKAVYSEMMAGARENLYTAPPEISKPPWSYNTDLYDADPVPLGANQQQFLEEAGLPLEGYHGVYVFNVSFEGDRVGPYLNYVHRGGSAVLCWVNLAKDDAMGENRLHWSDIMAASCFRTMAAMNAGGGHNSAPRCGMTALLAIVRFNVVNRVTTAVVVKVHSQRPRATPGPLTLRPGEADFFALLGTENGKGVARMLGAYPRMFDQKIIASTRIDPIDPPSICWVLEKLEEEPAVPAEAVSPRPMSHKEARKAKKRQERQERTL
ncbi:hypothetical protein F5144DRAFT_655860 [Chaetomium tenue]|uniref:Uncharacterized protein n=1 Tax=Chaetomium tenue TaxID=1854479 RepID=A0ACB7NY58_9PEZI|nr:hypothetical protein F5144DRAFT_655860 [Chaetomium globosum]